MILSILLCFLIAASPLAYAVYRAYKLAEVERLCRRQWPSTILGEYGSELISSAQDFKPVRPGLPHRYADGHLCGCRDCKASLPPDAAAIVQQIGKAEPVGWFDSAGNWYEAPQPQTEYIVTEKHYDAVGEWWTASLSDDPEIIAPGETKIEAIENVMKKFEKLPQPDYEEIQAVYPADWKPGE